MQQNVDTRPLLAEAIATFALIFVGAGSILANNVSGGALGIVGIALAHGLILMAMIYATAHISGAHINPAVTIALWASKRITTEKALLYIVAQLFGAMLAGLLLDFIFIDASSLVYLGTPTLGAGVDFWRGVLIEMVLTFFLMFTILGLAVDQRAPKGFFGIGIGLVITADILLGGVMTGGSMNPARTFGPAIAAGYWDNHLVYWIGPIAGALLATAVYHFLMSEDKMKGKANKAA